MTIQPIDKDVNSTEYFLDEEADSSDDWEDNPFRDNDSAIECVLNKDELEYCRTTEVGETSWDLVKDFDL